MEVIPDLLRLTILLASGLILLVALLSFMLAWGLTHPPRITAGVAMARGWPVDPRDLGYDFEEWTLDRPGGVRLPVWEVSNPQNPDGPVIIISHCWGGSRITSLQRLDLLYDFASRLILWDARGHGDSTGSVSHLGSAADVADMLDLIDRIGGGVKGVGGRGPGVRGQRSAQSPGTPVPGTHPLTPSPPLILYGYSMGAGISICAAAEDAKAGRIAGVIADGAYRWTAEPIRALLGLHRLPGWPSMSIASRILCVFLPGLRGSERAKFAARLRCPLLVIHGTDDIVCPLESATEIAEAAPEAELVLFHGGGHLNLHRTDAQRYRRVAEAFIQRCVPPSSLKADRSAAVSGHRRADQGLPVGPHDRTPP